MNHQLWEAHLRDRIQELEQERDHLRGQVTRWRKTAYNQRKRGDFWKEEARVWKGHTLARISRTGPRPVTRAALQNRLETALKKNTRSPGSKSHRQHEETVKVGA